MELYSILISSNDEFSQEIKSYFGGTGHVLHHVSDLSKLNDFVSQTSGKPACLIIDLSLETDEDLELFLSKNKSKKDFKYVPVIGLIRKNGKENLPSRSLFFHLLEEPFSPESCLHTVDSAHSDLKRFLALLEEVNSRDSAIGLINSGTFRLQTMAQAEALTTMLSLACPESTTIALGLSELLVNAIEHGNLDISFEEKSNLMEQGLWAEEISKRIHDEKYKDRFVEIAFERTNKYIKIIVTDQGKGFDWKPYLKEEIDCTTAKHGRGIALALAMGFDELVYNEKGNEVIAMLNITESA